MGVENGYRGIDLGPYREEGLTGSFVSAYRPIQHALNQYRPGEFSRGDFSGLNLLDYGAGMGRLLRLMGVMGVVKLAGVDMSLAMLETARSENPLLPFAQMDQTLPFPEGSFDVVTSTVVLVDIGSREQLLHYFREALRVLRGGGVMVVVNATPISYRINTASFRCNFPENHGVKGNGELAKVVIDPYPEEQLDHVWSANDQIRAYQKTGLTLLERREVYEGQHPIWEVDVLRKGGQLDWRVDQRALYASAKVFSR